MNYVFKNKKQIIAENESAPAGGVVIIRTSSGYWGSGTDVKSAMKHLQSTAGDWLVNIYDTDDVTIWEDGNISAPRNSLVVKYSTIPVKG